MTLFEFVTVIISMVLAFAMGQMLLGVATLAKNRRRIRTYLPHTLWVINFSMLPVTLWWSLWDFRDVAWTFPKFGYLLLAPTCIFYIVALLVPDEIGPDGADLRDHYYTVRPFVWTMGLVYVLLTWFDGVILVRQEIFGLVGASHVPGLLTQVGGLLFTSHRAQLTCAALQLSVLLYFVFFVRIFPGLGAG